MSALNPSTDDAFPPKPWNYRKWRTWCDEHGEGPYLYQYWGLRRGYFVTLTLESWVIGIESDRPSDTEHWLTLRLGPLGFSLAFWSEAQ